jgi:hypothetical protein
VNLESENINKFQYAFCTIQKNTTNKPVSRHPSQSWFSTKNLSVLSTQIRARLTFLAFDHDFFASRARRLAPPDTNSLFRRAMALFTTQFLDSMKPTTNKWRLCCAQYTMRECLVGGCYCGGCSCVHFWWRKSHEKLKSQGAPMAILRFNMLYRGISKQQPIYFISYCKRMMRHGQEMLPGDSKIEPKVFGWSSLVKNT